MMKNLHFVLLSLIVGLALFLRTYKLADVPPGLNRDEAAIGYNAYSLLLSGKDEYGQSWPLSFKSFGDWKVPLYFYLTIPFVKVFDLTPFVVRLPSALSGTITVLLTYFLIQSIFETERLNWELQKLRTYKVRIGLFASLILAITPWHIFMSRTASESNVAVTLVTLGLVCFFYALRKKWLLLVTAFCFSLSLFTYHGNHIFTPLLVLSLILIYHKSLGQNRWWKWSLGVLALLAAIILSQTLLHADKTKISGLFPLGDTAKIYEEVVLPRAQHPTQNLVVTVIHNRIGYLIKSVIINYVRGLSPEFLFISGGTNRQHNIPNFGNLYLWEIFVWPIALFWLAKTQSRVGKFIIVWLLIAPVTASITRDAPHSAREMALLPSPALLSGFGLGILLFYVNSSWQKVGFILLAVGVICMSQLNHLDNYFIHFPLNSAQYWGKSFETLVSKVNRVEDNYKEVVISRPDISPYIYFLFFNKVDPSAYQKQVVRYPETNEGFQHVQRLGKLVFSKISWTDELRIPNRLYVDWVESIPNSATYSARFVDEFEYIKLQNRGNDVSELNPAGTWVTSRLVDTIRLPDASPYMYLIETRIGTPSAVLL